MELRQLRYFLAAAQEQNLRRAAARVHVTQPALSQQIAALEAELGVMLFDRLPRGLRLSAAGTVYAAKVQQALAALEAARDQARLAERGDTGHMCVAFNELGGQHHAVAEGLRRFRAAYPHVGLDLRQMSTADQREALVRGSIDAGFMHLLSGECDGFETLVLAHQRFALAMPSYHAYARRRRLGIGDLAGQPLLWLQRAINTALFDDLYAALRQGGIQPQVTLEASSDISMLNLVAAGVGLAIVADTDRTGGLRGIALRPLHDLAVSLRFAVVWRPEAVTPTLANFVATLQPFAAPAATTPTDRPTPPAG